MIQPRVDDVEACHRDPFWVRILGAGNELENLGENLARSAL